MGVSHIIIKDPIFVGGLNQTYMDSDEQILMCIHICILMKV